MGALSGAMSVRKFLVRGELPRDVRADFSRRIRLRRFRPLDPDEEVDERFGWCAVGQPLDLDLSVAKVFVTDYLLLGLRHDRFRIPPALLNARLQQALDAERKGDGEQRASKARKAELKERVMKDLRRKILPSLRAVDLVWNLDQGELFFWSQASGMCEKLCALFELTFGLELVENSPYVAAEQLIVDAPRVLSGVEPSSFHAEPSRRAAGNGQQHTSPVQEEA